VIPQDFLDEYREHLLQQGRSERTVGEYAADLKHFARWFEGTTGQPFSPEKVVPLDITTHRSYLQTVRGLAPSTVNRRLQSLRSFFRWAHGQGKIKENPAEDAESVSTTRRQFAPKSLTRDEAYLLLRTIQQQSRHSKRDYAIAQTMLQTGLRLSEVATLELRDVEIRPRSGRVRVRSGKGRKEREVPLNNTGRKALREYLEVRPPSPGIDNIFVSQMGKAMSARTIGHVIKTYARKAGLDDDVSAHTLRHTFATWYLQDNPGQLVELAALLGHSDLNTTAIYTQSSFDDVADKLERSSLNIDA
jgi:site-specific recombinase XerD